MIHASVELVEAMRGDGGYSPEVHSSPSACGQGRDSVFAWKYGPPNDSSTREDLRPVDCPVCLRLIHAEITAIDPVRWDALEERGLVSLPTRLDEHLREPVKE